MTLLSGFGFHGYRSFYGDLQLMQPLGKITLIAGQNNSGKSNVLRVAQSLDTLRRRAPLGLDAPKGHPLHQFELVIRLGDRDGVAERIIGNLGVGHNPNRADAIRAALRSRGFDLLSDGSVWLRFSQVDAEQEPMSLDPQATTLDDVYLHINRYYRDFGSWSDDQIQNARTFMQLLAGYLKLPPVVMVEASRRISEFLEGDQVDRVKELSGVGLIKRLGALQSPTLEKDEDRERFEAINEFLRTVLDDSTATLSIPQTADQINVRRGGMLLPLEQLGTGVTQVVILAAAATLESKTIVCMEEPEVHLHPLLQRKLLRYLNENTDNQYLIATHSAHLLDAEIASVFHATYTADKGTQLAFAGNPSQLSTVCYDLGYRPSDLLQTNCVVWVEGPSDRIYISHWLELLNPGLREGIDYTIMFYGGRLLSHLTSTDPEVSEFIKLRRLNRYLAIVIDSDKSSQGGTPNATKRRVRDEMEDPGLVWITQGRNIENYVPRDELSGVLKRMYSSKNLIANEDRWCDALRPVDKKDAWRPDKIKVAKEVTEHWKSGLKYLDLHQKMTALARLIETANGHQPDISVHAPKADPIFD